MSDLTGLLSEIKTLGGDTSATPLAWNQVAGDSQSTAPLTPVEKVLGYSRSYLSGPTFNFADNAEAAIASLFGGTYESELAQIRDQQNRFKRQTDYLDNAVEIASGLMLNPLQSVGAAKTLATTATGKLAQRLFTSAPAQAALAGAGAADGQDVLENAGAAAALGTGFSAAASVGGKILDTTAKQASRLKLSAYGIGAADIGKQVKKIGDDIIEYDELSKLPIVQAVKKAEAQGIINVSKDALENAQSIVDEQQGIGTLLSKVFRDFAKVETPNPSLGKLSNTIAYIDQFSGTAKQQARAAAVDELQALSGQIGEGKLADLQRLKVGLNFKYDENPYKGSIIKAIRSDLRQEIEDRVNRAADEGLLSPDVKGQVKTLNQKWGELAELKDVFVGKIKQQLGGNVVEDFIRANSTTGGPGSLNVASAITNNPVYGAIGLAANAARYPESLNQIADVAGLPAVNKTAQVLGDVLPEIVTGRSAAQAYMGTNQPKEEPLRTPNAIDDETRQLLDEIISFKSKSGEQDMTNDVEKKDISLIESEIDKDPFASTVYEIESGRNPTAKNPESSAAGGFQLISAMQKSLGVDDPFDLEQNFGGFKKLTDEHRAKFGNDPILLYSAHYLGSPLLSKVLTGKELSEKESKQVQFLQTKVLPRFLEIYQRKVLGTINV